MSRYITTKCPRCEVVLSSKYYGIEIGEPITQCPICKENVIKYGVYEYIMFDFFKYLQYYVKPLIYGGLIGILFQTTLLDWIVKIDKTNIKYIVMIDFLVGVLLSFPIIYINFLKEKKELLERTHDIYYLSTLYLNNLISEKDYINYSKMCKNSSELSKEEVMELKKEAAAEKLKSEDFEYDEDLEEESEYDEDLEEIA